MPTLKELVWPQSRAWSKLNKAYGNKAVQGSCLLRRVWLIAVSHCSEALSCDSAGLAEPLNRSDTGQVFNYLDRKEKFLMKISSPG